METIVYKNEFAVANYNEETGLYILTILPQSTIMRDSDWKKLMRDLLVITDTYKPKYILDDNRDRLYAYPPEIQQWTLELFIDTWITNGLKKYVQVLPTDFINELSTEQIIELANHNFTNLFENKFVSTYEEAIEWLNI